MARNKFVPGDSVVRMLPVTILSISREWDGYSKEYVFVYKTSDDMTWKESDLEKREKDED